MCEFVITSGFLNSVCFCSRWSCAMRCAKMRICLDACLQVLLTHDAFAFICNVCKQQCFYSTICGMCTCVNFSYSTVGTVFFKSAVDVVCCKSICVNERCVQAIVCYVIEFLFHNLWHMHAAHLLGFVVLLALCFAKLPV